MQAHARSAASIICSADKSAVETEATAPLLALATAALLALATTALLALATTAPLQGALCPVLLQDTVRAIYIFHDLILHQTRFIFFPQLFEGLFGATPATRLPFSLVKGCYVGAGL